MNRYDLNRVDELVNRLLDRDISATEKSSIMNELKQYPEYTKTLADYELIQSAVKNDRNILMPPKDFDKAVFAEVDKISRVLVPQSFFVRNKYALIGLLLLFVGFTGYFGQDLFKSDMDKTDLVTASKVDKTSQSTVQSSITSEIKKIEVKQVPVVSNSEVNVNSAKMNSSGKSTNFAKNTSTTKSIEKVAKHNLYKDTEVISTDLTKESKETIAHSQMTNPSTEFNESNKIVLENESIIDPRFNLVVVNSNFDKYRQNQITPFAISQNKYTRALFQNISKTDWLIQYRGLYAVSNPEKGLQGRNFYFNSYNFGGFVEAFDGIYLGAEFGAEPYSQIFLDPNTEIEFEQTPDIFYFGVAGKFELKNFKYAGIYPAAQLFAGSSSLGPILRSNLTLQYDIINNFGLFAGLEGGMVFYSNEGIWYNSGKLGLIGGLKIKL